MGRVGSKMSKPIPVLPHGAGVKSHFIPTPLPLWGEENPRGAKWGEAGQAGWDKIIIPTLNVEFKHPLISGCKIHTSQTLRV